MSSPASDRPLILVSPASHGEAVHAGLVRLCLGIRAAMEPWRGDPAVDAFFARCEAGLSPPTAGVPITHPGGYPVGHASPGSSGLAGERQERS